MTKLLDKLQHLLKKDKRLVSKDEILKNKVIELALKLDKKLIKLLLSDKKMEEVFFADVDLPAPRRFYVYVIRCENDSFYVGQTDNIDKRWLEHKQGKVEWTRKYKPIEIVHYEEYKNREQAVKREKELKTGFGRKWIKREFKNGKLRKYNESATRQAGGTLIFDKDKFVKFVSNKQFLPDSYTAFKNKIGLIDEKGEFISGKKEVVLSWPYKDCVLEGGMTKEDQKRDEIFWNEVLAPDEISRLFDSKVFTNAKRIDAKGEHKFDGFRTDENGDIKDNLIIKGNNLLALHSLKKRFAGKVKLIYIDPPYNREADTFYNDSFKHSSWLTFMKNRLEIARDLLREDGVIFISIDDSEQAYLKVLCDEVFGKENFRNIISIKTGESLRAIGGGESTKLKKKAEFIIFYTKDKKLFAPYPVYELTPLREIIESKKREGKKFEYSQILISEGTKKRFDEFVDGRGNKIVIFKHREYKIMRLSDFMEKKKIQNSKKELTRIFIQLNTFLVLENEKVG